MYVSPLEGQVGALRPASRDIPMVCAGPLSAALLLSLLDEIDYGVLLLNADARILHMNQLARAALTAGDAVWIDAGRLSAQCEQDEEVLAGALAACARGVRSLVSLDCNAGDFTLSFVPLNHAAQMAGQNGASTMVMMGRRTPCEPLTLQQFGRQRRLTRSEQALLPAICGGLSAEDIAVQMRMSVNTVRTHLGHIRTKTRVNSMRQLATLLTRLPPIRPFFKATQAD